MVLDKAPRGCILGVCGFEGKKRRQASRKSLRSGFGTAPRASNNLRIASTVSSTSFRSDTVGRNRARPVLSASRPRPRPTILTEAPMVEGRRARRSTPSGPARAPIESPARSEMLPIEVMNDTSESFVHKRLLGAATGFFSGGGPLGAIRGFVTSGGRPRASPPKAAAVMSRSRGFGGTGQRFRTGFGASRQRVAGPGAVAGGITVPVGVGNGCPSGFHPNKTDYMTQAGFVEAGTRCVRNRRRNLSNGRANTRALRRMAAWDKQERRLAKTLKSIVRGR